MRLFVGIPLPDSSIEELTRISLRYRSADDGLRWSAPESWHITLQFLGKVDSDGLACISNALGTLQHEPVSIQLGSLGFFDRVGVFFAGVELTSELQSLQIKVTTATLPCGFAPETRPYHPHITLARSRGKTGARSLRALQAHIQNVTGFKRFLAQEFVLYESLPTPIGSRYEVRNRFRLG
jgi:RNA 2',3'-cyclic 3'-phosphodiesterase